MGTVLFLTGESRGDSLKMIGRSYEALFNAQGLDFLLIDLRNTATAIATLNRVISERPIEFVFSFMGCGANLGGTDENGRHQNLWQGIGAPYLSLMGDSPAYFFDRHVATFPNFACLYGAPEHELLRRRLPRADGFIGGYRALLLDQVDLEEIDHKAKVGGQLFFLKNGNDPKALWDSWSIMQGRPRQALHELADYLATDLTNPVGNQIDDLVTSYFQDRDFNIRSMPKLRLFFIAQLDDYLRRVKSTLMAEALMDFPVQVVGVNWEHLDFSGKRAAYVKECDYPTSSRLIRDGLGVIDMSPNTGASPHDRACRAFGAYTLCVTNEQEFFREKLPYPDEVCFRFDRNSFQDKIADVIAHPARYIDIGIDVAEAFRKVNPPGAVIQHLIDTAALIRLDQRRNWHQSPDFFVWPPESLMQAA